MTQEPPDLPTEQQAGQLDFPSLAKRLRQFVSVDTLRTDNEWSHFGRLFSLLEAHLENTNAGVEQRSEEREPRFLFNAKLMGTEDSRLRKRLEEFQKQQAEKRIFWVKRLQKEATIAGIIDQFNAVELDTRREIKKWQTGNAGDYQFASWILGYFEASRAYFREWKERLVNAIGKQERPEFAHGFSDTDKIRWRIVEGLRKDSLERKVGSAKCISLPWVLLPKGQLGRTALLGHLQNFRHRHPKLSVQIDRIDFAYKLNPHEVFVGRDEFDGYFAFTFERSQQVLLEHPIEGHAAYVFTENWRFLSRLTKSSLLEDYKGLVQRVIHRHDGFWREQLKRHLHL
jgi:hypothetical protein